MKTATDKDILISARRMIKNGRKTFICHAICDGRVGTAAKKESLRKWVCKMLGSSHTTYEGWLSKNHPKIYMKHRDTDLCFVQARLQWIDWMIENCDRPASPPAQ